MSSQSNSYDAIIIGAGVSGLAAASHLDSQGYRTLVLEARDRLGGRVHSKTVGEEMRCDLGASFVHGKYDNPIHELMKKLGVSLKFDSLSGNACVLDRNGPLGEDLSNQLAMNLFSTMFSESRDHSHETNPSPTSSLASYIYSPGSPLYTSLPLDSPHRAQVTAMARALSGWTGAKYEDVSLRWWGFERETMGSDGAVPGGRYGEVAEYLRSDIKKGDVRLGEKVMRVSWDEEQESCTVTTQSVGDEFCSSSTFTAPYIICTIPLGVLKSTPPTFEPPLSPRKLRSIRSLGFGLLNKIFLRYEKAWWRDAKESGSYMLVPTKGREEELLPPSYKDFEELGLQSQALTFQNFMVVDGTPILMMFLGAEMGQAIDVMAKEEAIRWAHNIAANHIRPADLSLADVPTPIASDATHWLSDEYSRGSYTYIPCHPDPIDAQPVTPLDIAEFAVPSWKGALGFAGEHTHMDWYATVHGPYDSGLREARRVATELKMKREDEVDGR